MTTELWADNATGVLAGPAAAGATSISVTPASGATFPVPAANQQFHVILNGGMPGAQALNAEIVTVIDNASSVFTLASGLSFSHSSGEPVALIVTAEGLETLTPIVSIGGQGVTTLGYALNTLDQLGNSRNVIDDGSGNARIASSLEIPIAGVTPLASLHIIGGGAMVRQLLTPSAPTVSFTGTAGSTTYQYAVVARDQFGNATAASALGEVTNAAASLDASNYNTVTWTSVAGGASYDVIAWTGSAWQSVTLGVLPTGLTAGQQLSATDTGQARSPYTVQGNGTGNMLIDGSVTCGGVDATGIISTNSAVLATGQVQGSNVLNNPIVVTSNYTANPGDIVLVDASTAAVTVDLPAAVESVYQVAVKKIDSSANAVTVNPGSGVTIDGQATVVLSTQYEAIHVTLEGIAGIDWYVIGQVATTIL